ncbi:hypothetical protein LSAT2_024291 [Lamellibrachia satsuma]|nr:hypothetical protein LSAT2_024291 [Lamellibrachia satsuma]
MTDRSSVMPQAPTLLTDIGCEELHARKLVANGGWMRKQSRFHHKFSRSTFLPWFPKYVCLSRGCVYLFNGEQSTAPCGAFSLVNYTSVVRATEIGWKVAMWPFKVLHRTEPDKDHYFSCPAESEMKHWMAEIKNEMLMANGKRMSDVTSRDLYDYIEAEITGLPRSSTGYPVFELEERREWCELVHFWEAERISPDEWRHVCMAAGYECPGREDTLVRPIGPALLRVTGASNGSSISGAISLVVDGLQELSDAKDGDCPANEEVWDHEQMQYIETSFEQTSRGAGYDRNFPGPVNGRAREMSIPVDMPSGRGCEMDMLNDGLPDGVQDASGMMRTGVVQTGPAGCEMDMLNDGLPDGVQDVSSRMRAGVVQTGPAGWPRNRSVPHMRWSRLDPPRTHVDSYQTNDPRWSHGDPYLSHDPHRHVLDHEKPTEESKALPTIVGDAMWPDGNARAANRCIEDIGERGVYLLQENKHGELTLVMYSKKLRTFEVVVSRGGKFYLTADRQFRDLAQLLKYYHSHPLPGLRTSLVKSYRHA